MSVQTIHIAAIDIRSDGAEVLFLEGGLVSRPASYIVGHLDRWPADSFVEPVPHKPGQALTEHEAHPSETAVAQREIDLSIFRDGDFRGGFAFQMEHAIDFLRRCARDGGLALRAGFRKVRYQLRQLVGWQR